MSSFTGGFQAEPSRHITTLSTQSSQAFLPTDSTAGPDDLQYESDYNDDLS